MESVRRGSIQALFVIFTLLRLDSYTPVQNVGKHHILFDKSAPTATLFDRFPPTEPEPRAWTRRLCGQSLHNVIMNTVSLLSKQGIGRAASGVNCLHRCECVFMHESHLCV